MVSIQEIAEFVHKMADLPIDELRRMASSDNESQKRSGEFYRASRGQCMESILVDRYAQHNDSE